MSDSSHTASLERILRGKVPAFIVQRGAQHNARVPEVISTLSNQHGKKLGMGTAVKMLGMTPKAIGEYMAAVDSLPLRIADPVLFQHPKSVWEGLEGVEARKRPLPFDFYSDLPSSVDHVWISKVIQAQYDVGATVSLSATGWVPTTNAAASLELAMNMVRESRQVVGDNPMFVNLTLDREWLINRDLRNLLLRELVESNEKHWYLRFYWPELKNAHGQLADEDVLRGYISLASTSAIEGKNLFLPNSGLTGWLMGAYGAAGFSTGSSSTDQAFARRRRIARRPGQIAPPPTPRIFDRFLLHTMDHTVFEQIRTLPGHRQYSTVFLDEIDEGSHDRELAGLHYLNSVGNLQAKMSAADRRVVAQRAVTRAIRWLHDLDDLDRPSGASSPVHLDAWNGLAR